MIINKDRHSCMYFKKIKCAISPEQSQVKYRDSGFSLMDDFIQNEMVLHDYIL